VRDQARSWTMASSKPLRKPPFKMLAHACGRRWVLGKGGPHGDTGLLTRAGDDEPG